MRGTDVWIAACRRSNSQCEVGGGIDPPAVLAVSSRMFVRSGGSHHGQFFLLHICQAEYVVVVTSGVNDR